MLGFKFKVAENDDTSLGYINRGKRRLRQNIVYKSRSTLCNGKEKGKEEKELADTREDPYIYVAESTTETTRKAMRRALGGGLTRMSPGHNSISMWFL